MLDSQTDFAKSLEDMGVEASSYAIFASVLASIPKEYLNIELLDKHFDEVDTAATMEAWEVEKEERKYGDRHY